MSEPTYRSRVEGCLYGLALGDALGAPTEFMKYSAIVEKYGPLGPEEPSELVTDDTQMALATGEALMSMADLRSSSADDWAAALRKAYLDWYYSPENNRRPGKTCMEALGRLTSRPEWQKATEVSSKGCGANMRVPPVGLLSLSAIETDDGAPLSIGALALAILWHAARSASARSPARACRSPWRRTRPAPTRPPATH